VVEGMNGVEVATDELVTTIETRDVADLASMSQISSVLAVEPVRAKTDTDTHMHTQTCSL